MPIKSKAGLNLKGGNPTQPEVETPAQQNETPVQNETPAQNETPNQESVKYGSKRKSLAFVKPLGDASNPDTTKIKDSDEKKVTSTIVGYEFEVLEDGLKIPDCGTTEAFKNDPMNYKEINFKVAKKGDKVALTPFEMALLLSQPEFNGGCDGGEIPVLCVYQKPKIASAKSGAVSSVTKTPRVTLRAATGSIKDHSIFDIITFTKTTVNGVTRKNRSVVAGYEKWAPLAATATRTTSGGKSQNDATVANLGAQAFLQFVKNRK